MRRSFTEIASQREGRVLLTQMLHWRARQVVGVVDAFHCASLGR